MLNRRPPLVGRLVGLLRDNPVLEKDVSIALRAPQAPLLLAAAGLFLLGVAVLVHAAVEPSWSDLATWRTFNPSGRAMFASVTGALLALETFFLPALASSAIAGERERGTLSLLQLSALSPARIVVGKLAALLVTLSPLLALALPVLALASIYGGVQATDVLFAAGLLAVHALALAATGLGASSLVARARLAAPLAMAFSLGPSIVVGIPGAVALALIGDGGDAGALRAVLVTGVFAELCLGAGGIVLAHEQLSPRSAPRQAGRHVVLGAWLVALPVAGAFCFTFLRSDDRSVHEATFVASCLGVLALMLTASLFAVSFADGGRSPREGPLRQAFVVVALGAVGLVLARGVGSLAPWAAGLQSSWPGVEQMPWAGTGVMTLYLAFVAFLAAAVARGLRRPLLRIVITVVLLVTLFVLPIALHELRWLFGLEPWALGFTNPVLVVTELMPAEGSGDTAPAAGGAFYLVSAVVLGIIARHPPASGAPRPR